MRTSFSFPKLLLAVVQDYDSLEQITDTWRELQGRTGARLSRTREALARDHSPQAVEMLPGISRP